MILFFAAYGIVHLEAVAEMVALSAKLEVPVIESLLYVTQQHCVAVHSQAEALSVLGQYMTLPGENNTSGGSSSSPDVPMVEDLLIWAESD